MTFTYRLRSRCQDKKIAVALLGATAIGLTGPVQAQLQGMIGPGGALATMPAPPTVPIGGAAKATVTGTEAPPTENAPPGEAAAAPRRLWAIVPRITVAETFTDNVAPASGVKRSDQVTELSPGVRFDSEGARLKFHLDYQLRQLLYAQSSGNKDTQNYLNAFGSLEAIEKWLFVDVTGVVAQQEINPFGFQTISNVNVNPNRVETSSFRVSPYVRGKLGAAADYEVRYDRSTTQSNSAAVADVNTEGWRGSIKGATSLTTLGWTVEASHSNVDFSGGRNTVDDRYRGFLTYRFDPEFRVSVSAGQEANNFTSTSKETHDTQGFGFDWLPSERTQVSAFKEKRFFGHGHTVSINHRTPLTAFSFTDTRDLAILPGRFNTVGFGSIYNLLFAQLAATVPDPIQRGRYLDNLLQQFGIAPDVQVTRGFFTSQVSVQRRQELSYSLQGARNILTLSVGRTQNEAVGPTASASDIFSISPNIRQRGAVINFSHRLTPLSSLNMTASKQDSTGSGANTLSSTLRSLHIGVTTQLGPKTTGSLGVRRVLFDSNTAGILPYSENALIGALTLLF